MNKSPHIKRLSFYLILILGLIILYPMMNYHSWLSQGDHGRDLYAAVRTLNGDVPYQDYWWVYGPLMPYYYAFFMKVLGVSLLSILTGKTLLLLGSGLFIFLTLRTLWSPTAGIAGAAWFFLFNNDFFITQNHVGGTFLVTATMACMAKYIRQQDERWLWRGITAASVLLLIKANFGMTALIILAATAFLTDRAHGIKTNARKRFFYLCCIALIPAVAVAIYWGFLYGLSWYEIRQCLPYASSDQPHHMNPFNAFGQLYGFFFKNLMTNLRDFLFCIVVVFGTLRSFYLLTEKKLKDNEHRALALTVILFGFYYVLNLHEYLQSGVWYRSIWSQAPGIIWMFSCIAAAAASFNRYARMLIWSPVFLLIFLGFQDQREALKVVKTSEHYFPGELGGAYVRNDVHWLNTVQETTAYLKKQLGPNDLFFALPYDNIYYYLTGKKSPTRQLIFFDHINIPREQEEKVVRDLEKHHVNYILLSSRMHASEEGLGTFGVTYCPLLGRYVQEYFEPVAKFGNWENEPGWAWNHGTLILKRK